MPGRSLPRSRYSAAAARAREGLTLFGARSTMLSLNAVGAPRVALTAKPSGNSR